MVVYSGESCLGDKLNEMLAKAEKNVVLVAPFIKSQVMKRLLSIIPPEVPVYCVTRWRPDEIVSGVSDIEVWPLIKARRNSRLMLYYNLHAKYYRADNRCMIGSANLTNTALAWVKGWNLEIMVELSAQSERVKLFEQYLLGRAVEVDDAVYENILDATCNFERHIRQVPVVRKQFEEVPECSRQTIWVPTLRHPQDLYSVYTDNTGHLLSLTVLAGEADLAVLDIPRNLPEEVFNSLIKEHVTAAAYSTVD